MLQGQATGSVPMIEASGLQYDSRKLRRGEAFFAFPGERVDGHRFVPQAMAAGASAVVSERRAPSGMDARWARVRHGRRALAEASLRFYDRPERDLVVTAVTGTNGKTTTAHFIDALLRSSGRRTALIGTIEHRVGTRTAKAVNTTPESLDVVRMLADLRSTGGTHATMEASSHALSLGRIHGLRFHTAVFTNLTQDHLDFHGDMESYAAAKRRLFEGAGADPPRFAVINSDDPTGRRFLRLGLSESVSYGRGAAADVRPSAIKSDASGTRMDVETPRGPLCAETRLIGDFNVDNLLAAIGAAQCNGLANEEIEAGLRSLAQVRGRFESVEAGQPFLVVVDYAHTEDALRRLIHAARSIAGRGRSRGRVLVLFGCGGDRDRSKRGPMGRAAGQLADVAILTSDNPRSEDPLSIIEEVERGLRGTDADRLTEVDRGAAIAAAVGRAREGDIVLIAGKGHETSQVLADRTIPFDDRSAVLAALADLGYSRP